MIHARYFIATFALAFPARQTQLPIYMKQEKTKQAIYLIIDNGHPKALEHFIAFYNELDKEIKRKISYFIIDATMRPSASKA